MHLFFLCTLYLILWIISLQDIKTYEVSDRYFVFLFLLLFCYPQPLQQDVLFLGCFFAVLFVFYLLQMLGGADIKLLLWAALIFERDRLLYCFLLSNLLGLCVCLLTQKKKIPFIPCIAFGIFLFSLFL